MDSSIVAMDPLQHFLHKHPLNLVYLQQPTQKKENVDDEDEDEDEVEDEVEFVEEDHQCNLCMEQIWSFHLCYYSCKTCDYSLHKLCAELPQTLENHPLHPGHRIILLDSRYKFKCSVCNFNWGDNFEYGCDICDYEMDIICATMAKQKIKHPSHPHQLERVLGHKNILPCVACGSKHEGVFFHCTTCPGFSINLDCALLPAKLFIQSHTDGTFTHSHILTLAYSFPRLDRRANFHPRCRVCDQKFPSHLWIYKCDKCRYYLHVDCATSKREPFMSIFETATLGKTFKNFKEDEYPNLLQCPFQDEGENLLKRHMSKQHELIGNSKKLDGEMLIHASHQHPLRLFDKQTSVGLSLHDPMKRTQLLCDGCVKPIMTVPFYMCCQYDDEQCCFVLHEWCAKLPPTVPDYVGNPEHTLFLLPKMPTFFGVFECAICKLLANGFAYGCTKCKFYVDINCAFIPKEITHDAHPDHLLSILVKPYTQSDEYSNACKYTVTMGNLVFHCPSCNFYVHVECALLLPRVIKHKCDKHPLSISYEPAEY